MGDVAGGPLRTRTSLRQKRFDDTPYTAPVIRTHLVLGRNVVVVILHGSVDESNDSLLVENEGHRGGGPPLSNYLSLVGSFRGGRQIGEER